LVECQVDLRLGQITLKMLNSLQRISIPQSTDHQLTIPHQLLV